MSRSRKRTPVCGNTTAASEKQDKRLYNRRYRRACKIFLGKFDEDGCLPLLREHSSVWVMEKDGKRWFDPIKHPEEMRK